jgi:hypothetical protein
MAPLITIKVFSKKVFGDLRPNPCKENRIKNPINGMK